MRYYPLESRPHPCGYFDDRQALFEHYLIDQTSPHEREILLACGFRAFGKYTFRPHCEGCQRCVPIRVPVRDFRPHKGQRRILRKAGDIRLTVGVPEYTEEKLAVYHAHSERFPRKEAPQAEREFRLSFYEPDVPTLEFCYYLKDRLIAVGIVHETPTALSSVYFTYLPDYGQYRLGTLSTLQEIAFAASHGKRYLYLGYYIRDNHFMSYKKSFYPNEVLLSSEGWRHFRDRKGKYLLDDSLAFQPFPVIQ